MRTIFLTLMIIVPFFLFAQTNTEKKVDLNTNLDLNKHKEQKGQNLHVCKQEVKTLKLDSALIHTRKEIISKIEPKKKK